MQQRCRLSLYSSEVRGGVQLSEGELLERHLESARGSLKTAYDVLNQQHAVTSRPIDRAASKSKHLSGSLLTELAASQSVSEGARGSKGGSKNADKLTGSTSRSASAGSEDELLPGRTLSDPRLRPATLLTRVRSCCGSF